MDTEYNNKLKSIMERHGTDVWNANCENDPEYGRLHQERFGFQPKETQQYSEETGRRRYAKSKKNPIGHFSIGSYRFRSKR